MNFTNPTLKDIVAKTKGILRSSVNIQDALIIKEIQQFMDFELPNVLDLKTFRSTWNFSLEPLQSAYHFNTARFTTIGDRVLVNSVPIKVYQEEDIFFSNYGRFNTFGSTVNFSGNGGSSYSFTLSQNLVRGYKNRDGYIQPRVFINAQTQNKWIHLKDDGNSLIPDEPLDIRAASINYQTGLVNIEFRDNIPSGNPIHAMFNTCKPGYPHACVFKNSMLEFRPVPDISYVVQVNAYLKPSVLINESDPLAYNWLYDYISFGSAIRIYEILGNTETIQRLSPTYNKYEAMVIERSSRQDANLNNFSNIYTSSVYGDNLKDFRTRRYW